MDWPRPRSHEPWVLFGTGLCSQGLGKEASWYCGEQLCLVTCTYTYTLAVDSLVQLGALGYMQIQGLIVQAGTCLIQPSGWDFRTLAVLAIALLSRQHAHNLCNQKCT